MNVLDRAIGYVSPGAAVRRARAREVLAYYEAAQPSKQHKNRRAPGTGNLSVGRAGRSLREQARYLEQNHDLARGVLADLILKTVGPYGIVPEPQPRRADGAIHEEFAQLLIDGFKEWAKRPEVTGQHDWPSAQRLAARGWIRDGEAFAQALQGRVGGLRHGSDVPLSIELMECDLVPLEYSLPPTIVQGIEINSWGRPQGYWSLIVPPGDIFSGYAILPTNLQRIPAERMFHIALRDRVRQLRGVSIFAACLNRFDDLKDYEESERIAAKVAASMAGYIKKGLPDEYSPQPSDALNPNGPEPRDLRFRPGMIFDDLRPGEDIGTIDTKRPNANLLTYRQGQMRAIASGTTTSFSSIAKDYNGTYSAQRQELVEAWSGYATLAAEFTNALPRPVYEMWCALAFASGVIEVPADVVPATADDAIYIAPQMPWIDPENEAIANVTLENAGYDSGPAIIRRRGGSPSEVLAQEARWLKAKEKAGIPSLQPPAQAPKQPQTTSATASLGGRGPR